MLPPCPSCGEVGFHAAGCGRVQKPGVLYVVGGTHARRIDYLIEQGLASSNGNLTPDPKIKLVSGERHLQGVTFGPEDELVVVGEVPADVDRHLAMLCQINPPKGWA